jgi:hypothetical protein
VVVAVVPATLEQVAMAVRAVVVVMEQALLHQVPEELVIVPVHLLLKEPMVVLVLRHLVLQVAEVVVLAEKV